MARYLLRRHRDRFHLVRNDRAPKKLLNVLPPYQLLYPYPSDRQHNTDCFTASRLQSTAIVANVGRRLDYIITANAPFVPRVWGGAAVNCCGERLWTVKHAVPFDVRGNSPAGK